MSSNMELDTFTHRRLKRERTISSDSGCCLGEAAPLTTHRELDILLQEVTLMWMEKIETVVMGGFAKLREKGCPDEKYALESTKIDLLSLIDSIPEIVEKENIKIKDLIESKLEFLFDKHEKLSVMNDANIKKRKADEQIQNKFTKLRKYYSTTQILQEFEDDNEVNELFDDWDWSSDEWENDAGITEEISNPAVESIFPAAVEMASNENDSPWNDFNFWRLDHTEDLPRIPDDVLSVELLNGDLIGYYHPEADDLVVKANQFSVTMLNIWSFLEIRKATSSSRYFTSDHQKHWAKQPRHIKNKRFNVPAKNIFFKSINIKQPKTCH